MRYLLLLYTFLFFSPVVLCAQNVKTYIALVKTKDSGNERGVLYHVTPDALVLDIGDSLIVIKSTEIRKIKIYASNTPYQYKKVFSYTPWDENNFETRPNELVRVRKSGQKDQGVKEEIGGHVANAAMNAVVNLIAAPFNSINNSVFKVNINQDADQFNKVRNDLYHYSIYYQRHTDYKDELKKINR